tara:strand:- start:2120 stop:2275 length:156 start_codon:yes stop_codon:yes gene_type:complete
MEHATYIIAWLAMLVYIASSAFDVWEKFRRYKRERKIEKETEHMFFGDGLE